MKSVVVEASTVAKAIETAWLKAEKPEEFFIRVLQEHYAGFLGFGHQKAKIVLFFKNNQKVDTQFPTVLKQKEYANLFDNPALKVPTQVNVVDAELNKNIQAAHQKQKQQKQQQKPQQVNPVQVMAKQSPQAKQIQEKPGKQDIQVVPQKPQPQIKKQELVQKNQLPKEQKQVVQEQKPQSQQKQQSRPDKPREQQLSQVHQQKPQQQQPKKHQHEKEHEHVQQQPSLKKVEKSLQQDHSPRQHNHTKHVKQEHNYQHDMSTIEVVKHDISSVKMQVHNPKDDLVKDIARVLKKVQSQKIVSNVSRILPEHQETQGQPLVKAEEKQSRVQPTAQPKFVQTFKRRPLSTDKVEIEKKTINPEEIDTLKGVDLGLNEHKK